MRGSTEIMIVFFEVLMSLWEQWKRSEVATWRCPRRPRARASWPTLTPGGKRFNMTFSTDPRDSSTNSLECSMYIVCEPILVISPCCLHSVTSSYCHMLLPAQASQRARLQVTKSHISWRRVYFSARKRVDWKVHSPVRYILYSGKFSRGAKFRGFHG